MLKCTAFLLFDGNCAEAMTFYQKCLGGELTLTKLVDTPMKAQFPEEKHQRIIYAQLKSNSLEFSATDWMAAPDYLPKQGNTFSMYITSSAYGELKEVFDKLSEGANAAHFQDLHEMPFGSYGQLTDKFGVPWTFVGRKQ